MVCTYQSTSSLQSHDCHTSIFHSHHCRQFVHIKLHFRHCPGLNLQPYATVDTEDRCTLPTSRSSLCLVSVHFPFFMKKDLKVEDDLEKTTQRKHRFGFSVTWYTTDVFGQVPSSMVCVCLRFLLLPSLDCLGADDPFFMTEQDTNLLPPISRSLAPPMTPFSCHGPQRPIADAFPKKGSRPVFHSPSPPCQARRDFLALLLIGGVRSPVIMHSGTCVWRVWQKQMLRCANMELNTRVESCEFSASLVLSMGAPPFHKPSLLPATPDNGRRGRAPEAGSGHVV